MTSAIDGLTERVQLALSAPGCERLAEWAAIGPVQRAAVEQFASGLLPDENSIAQLEARIQELGEIARQNRSVRVVQLEAQLEAARAQSDALHDAIMNIPCNVPYVYETTGLYGQAGYRRGHRDARHAAAELVNAMKGQS